MTPPDTDGIRLLETILEPCEGIDEHSWRKCRRCTALHGIENRFPLSISALESVLGALREREREIEALKADRDEWMASSAGYGSDMVEWKIRAEAAEVEIEALKADVAKAMRCESLALPWPELLERLAKHRSFETLRLRSQFEAELATLKAELARVEQERDIAADTGLRHLGFLVAAQDDLATLKAERDGLAHKTLELADALEKVEAERDELKAELQEALEEIAANGGHIIERQD
jgi:chromosome segregation ATPase